MKIQILSSSTTEQLATTYLHNRNIRSWSTNTKQFQYTATQESQVYGSAEGMVVCDGAISYKKDKGMGSSIFKSDGHVKISHVRIK